jgi:hypothetical protein
VTAQQRLEGCLVPTRQEGFSSRASGGPSPADSRAARRRCRRTEFISFDPLSPDSARSRAGALMILPPRLTAARARPIIGSSL